MRKGNNVQDRRLKTRERFRYEGVTPACPLCGRQLQSLPPPKSGVRRPCRCRLGRPPSNVWRRNRCRLRTGPFGGIVHRRRAETLDKKPARREGGLQSCERCAPKEDQAKASS